jgi:hypothetical protein
MRSEIATVVANAEIIPRLAPSCGAQDGDAIPEEIVGSTILGFGTINRYLLPESVSPVEVAGLVIDYLPCGGEATRRVVFGFTELGMWVEYQGEPEAKRVLGPIQDSWQL